MEPSVKIAFDLSLAGGGNFFTLDDPTNGQLDFSPYGLADEVADVTEDVRSVTFRRGRSSETQNIDAGSANVVLDNRQRKYDPLVSASVSPYAPSIIPRKALFIELLGQRVFSGQIEDWDLQYGLGGDSISIAKTADPFTLLTQQVYASGVGATGLTGSVIYDSAVDAGWSEAKFDLDVGTASIGSHTIVANTNVLSYLQLIAGSETGLVFIGKDGALTFRDRTSALLRTSVLFTDEGDGIPFSNIKIEYGTEFLYTRIEVEWTGGTVTAENLVASANYGLTTLSVKTLLGTSLAAQNFADFLVKRYKDPTVRIRGLQVQMNALPLASQQEIVDLDIGSVLYVQFTPNGIGEPIYRELQVEGIQHSITPAGHTVEFDLFEPFLLRFSGSVLGTSTSTGTVVGAEGNVGTILGSSDSTGTVVGVEGDTGVVTGSSDSTGTVVGVKASFFTLDTSELDSTDTLGA
jgi:hypothetical protein